jgi:hypothetical protein
MKKYLVGPALTALAMFVFGAIFWMSPLPYTVLTPADNDRAALAVLGSVFPTTGTYVLPGPNLDTATATALYEAGPSAIVQFVREGHPMMEPTVLLKGYLHTFVVAFLLTILLNRLSTSLKCYWCTVRLCTFIGLIGGVLLCCSDPIWWHHAWGWHLMGLLYCVLVFAVAGLVLGKFVKPLAPPPA